MLLLPGENVLFIRILKFGMMRIIRSSYVPSNYSDMYWYVFLTRDKHQRPLYDTIHVLATNPVVLYSMQVQQNYLLLS